MPVPSRFKLIISSVRVVPGSISTLAIKLRRADLLTGSSKEHQGLDG